MKIFYVFASLALLLTTANAALVSSVVNGNWSNSAIWNPSPPAAGDDVVIGHNVVLDVVGASLRSLSVVAAKTFTVVAGSRVQSASLNVSGTVAGGGLLQVGDLFMVGSACSLRMTVASAVVEISGNIYNELNKFLEAPVIRLTGVNTVTLSGTVQTNAANALQLANNARVVAGTAGARFGGAFNLQGNALTVEGGASLVGSSLNGGSITSTPDGSNIVINPTSSFSINSSVTLNAATGGIVLLSNSKTLSFGRNITVNINNFVTEGTVSGVDVSLYVSSYTARTTKGTTTLTGVSLLDIESSYSNELDNTVDVALIRLSGASLAVSGTLQTNRLSTLSIVSTLSLNPGAAGIKLGGTIVLRGFQLIVNGGNVSLVGNSIQDGEIITSDAAGFIIVNPAKTTLSVLGSGAKLTCGDNGQVYVAAARRLDVSGSAVLNVNNLAIEGTLLGSSRVNVNNLMMVASTAAVTMSGGASRLSIYGNVDNRVNAVLYADAIYLERPSSDSRTVAGLIQSSKALPLILASDQYLASGAASANLGGILNLGSFTLRTTGALDVILGGSAITGTGGSIMSSANIIVLAATGTAAYGVVAGASVNLVANGFVNVTSGRTVTVNLGATLSATPLLLLDSGSIAGTGTLRINHVDMRTAGVANTGIIKMDVKSGVVDLRGDVNNPNNLVFLAANVRISGAYSRKFVGSVQTSATSLLTLLSSISISADSSATLGGLLALNGQSITFASNLILATGSIYGPGSVRFDEGCSCNPLTLTLNPSGTLSVNGTVFFQNALVNLAATKTLDIARNSAVNVAGAKSVFTVNGKVSGSGRLSVYSAQVTAAGRIGMATTLSIVEYVVPITNAGAYPVAASIVRAAPAASYSGCEDADCMAASFADLRRQVQVLSGMLSGNCADGNAPRWNYEMTAFGCSA